jgi:hypothetical protein
MVFNKLTVCLKSPQCYTGFQAFGRSNSGPSFALNSLKGLSMKSLLLILTSLLTLNAFGASDTCSLDAFVKSPEGQEKLVSLVDRSKGLILSKLEELGIEESQVQIKAVYPKKADDLRTSLSVLIKAKNLNAEGSAFTMSKVIRDEDCGIEISILGGHILNRESGKDFGTLGRVKEFIRLN